MNDVELQALIALQNTDTACLNADVAKYGQQMCTTDTPVRKALYNELLRRGIIKPTEEIDDSIPF